MAALPVMEGKAVLFKTFANIDAYPLCLDVAGADEIVATVVAVAPGFGGINLEDIASPACFEVEARLQALLDIPVFHDDQHGTAVVVLAGLLNACRVTAGHCRTSGSSWSASAPRGPPSATPCSTPGSGIWWRLTEKGPSIHRDHHPFHLPP
jgi:Malic enzyme, N-terminal domain